MTNRKCIITREVKDRQKMFRINITKDNTISLDLEHTLQGRGYYVSKDKVAITRARKALPKIARIEIDQDIFDQMESKL